MLNIQVLDAQGKLLAAAPLHFFVPPENVILDLSMEFFQDPQPCMIHRSAVLCRIYVELEEELEKRNGSLRLEEMSPSVRAAFHSQPAAFCVVVGQAGAKASRSLLRRFNPR